MILPDVNVLVHAYRVEAPRHDDYRSWLVGVINGNEELALTDHSVTGFLRIVSNPRIFEEPAPAAEAMGFVRAIQRAQRARSISASASTWATLTTWVADDRQIRGNLVPDAYLAALAVTHGCRLATGDRGYGRFPGLEFFDPAQ